MKIRKAKKDDFEEVFKLLKQLWPHEKIIRNKSLKIYKKLLKSKSSFMLVVEENRKVIGYASVRFLDDFEVGGRIGYLNELIVDESYQGKGIGKKFLKEVMKKAKKSGCKELQFPSTLKREKAHKLYNLLGFNKMCCFFWKELK